MKMQIRKLSILAVLIFLSVIKSSAQQKQNDYLLNSATTVYDNRVNIVSLLNSMSTQDNQGTLNQLVTILTSAGFGGGSTDVSTIINSSVAGTNPFITAAAGVYSINKDAAIVVLYRTIKLDPNVITAKAKPAIAYVPATAAVAAIPDATGIIITPAVLASPGVNAVAAVPAQRGEGLSIDFTSLNSIIYHKDAANNWSNYLLNTKKILVVLIDAGRNFYEMNSDRQENQLSNSQLTIKYKTSFFKQSFKGLKDLLPMVGVMGVNDASPIELKFTLFLVDPKRVNSPCDISIQNKTFAKDQDFPIHEKNYASFQVGLVNNKYSLNQFSISNDSLFVKPDASIKESWKSNVYALLELHLPRDIDNFQPLWKVAFGKNPYHNKSGFGRWLYNMTLDRIGIYGGLKISKDPLSNLYSGFTYSITKELNVNFGWTWENQVIPQVTEIGSISSINDALKFAKRKYSTGQFSWGLSFSPTSIISMFGKGDSSK